MYMDIHNSMVEKKGKKMGGGGGDDNLFFLNRETNKA